MLFLCHLVRGHRYSQILATMAACCILSMSTIPPALPIAALLQIHRNFAIGGIQSLSRTLSFHPPAVPYTVSPTVSPLSILCNTQMLRIFCLFLQTDEYDRAPLHLGGLYSPPPFLSQSTLRTSLSQTNTLTSPSEYFHAPRVALRIHQVSVLSSG